MKPRLSREALQQYEEREHSLVKHTILESYLERLLMIVGQWAPKIAYIDGFAGPWKSAAADLSDTSPGIAIRTMAACQANLASKLKRTVRVRSVFLETDDERASLLEQHIPGAPANIVRPEVWRKPFESAIPDLLKWLEPDEFAFVFVDPFGWKGIVEPSSLAPLLQRSKTELLINFMWNFINLATGHDDQSANLIAIFGEGWEVAATGASETKRRDLMHRYRQRLTDACRGITRTRLRTAMLPVEYVHQDKVVFYLVYTTHNPTGLVTFHEEAEETSRQQKRLKLQYRLDKLLKNHGQADIFTADGHDAERRTSLEEVKRQWLAFFPNPGSELQVDPTVMADLIEHSDFLLSEYQIALAELIEEGVIENTQAKRPRSKFAVKFAKKGELLRRLR
ncbi:three-Cys-motif partner protein [Luteibacter rhizovicinus]|uniref:Three-Cys-motif partner protein n=1 Tax=Luteibacter rhizovicinus TaxID=242606 RepID=A0A4R3YX28_9GAMM|nr:three-Cys-motif partner protein TcmP [Luteibacter rhizovicinus]TCV97727.1 three-Cys-motif partner protein [Luteibacter rhizovicinus]